MIKQRDTSTAAGEAQRAALRHLSPSERLALALQMSDEARALAADGVRHRRPSATDAEVDRAVRRLLLGEELANQVDKAKLGGSMTLGQLLAGIGHRLSAVGIPFMVTGSVASSFHGEPRSTRDIDIVIDPTPEALDDFVQAMPGDQFYVDVGAARAAFAERTQFNVIEKASGWKIDLMIRKDRPFSVEEFARRQPAELIGTSTFVATAEDLIIAKLEWAKAAESERQLRDVAAILTVNRDVLDYAYIERWVSALDLNEVWSQVRSS